MIPTQLRAFAALALASLLCAPLAAQKTDDATRVKNRTQLADLLKKVENETKLHFVQSAENPFNYSAILTTGLTTAERIEVIAGATDSDTIFINAYPKYKGGYINVDKVKDPPALMRQLLRLTARTFLHWGVDASGDVFCGFTFTLESGFPAESIAIVLHSVVNHDQYLTEIKALIE